MKPVQILQAALSLIADPAKWAKEHEALDGRGIPVKPTDERAKCFCMVGAIQRVSAGATADAYGRAIGFLRGTCGGSIFEFNDTHGHKAVKAVIRKAIAAAEVAA